MIAKTCKVHHRLLHIHEAELHLTGLVRSQTCQDRLYHLFMQDQMADLTGHSQQTCTTSIPNNKPSFLIFDTICPTPTAQWCAGPWLFQSFTNRRAPMENL